MGDRFDPSRIRAASSPLATSLGRRAAAPSQSKFFESWSECERGEGGGDDSSLDWRHVPLWLLIAVIDIIRAAK